MANLSKTTKDHDEIRTWAEARGGQPSCVRNTGGKGDIGILRIDFPGFSGETSLEHITWEEFFEKFDENKLSLVYQEETAGGEKSNFNKLVSAETADENEERAAKRGPAKKGAKKKAASSKKAAPQKGVAKKLPSKTATKAIATKKSSAKKAAPQKTSGKKAAPKKATGKKTASKVAARKTPAKKTAAKNAPAKKAAAKKGAAKKTTAKKALAKRTGRR